MCHHLVVFFVKYSKITGGNGNIKEIRDTVYCFYKEFRGPLKVIHCHINSQPDEDTYRGQRIR